MGRFSGVGLHPDVQDRGSRESEQLGVAWLGWCGVPTGSGGGSGGDRQSTHLPGISLGGMFPGLLRGEVLAAPTRQQATSLGAV